MLRSLQNRLGLLISLFKRLGVPLINLVANDFCSHSFNPFAKVFSAILLIRFLEPAQRFGIHFVAAGGPCFEGYSLLELRSLKSRWPKLGGGFLVHEDLVAI